MAVSDAKLIINTLGTKEKRGATYCDGTVMSVRGNVAYVNIDGGAQRTPCQLAMSAKVGDKVKVSIIDHTASITGNYTTPATGDAEALAARRKADAAFDSAMEAYGSAQTAAAAATAASASAGRAAAAADTAETKARDAETAANTAIERAQDAETAANTAIDQANTATRKADEASASAYNANEYAARALGHLGTVESVAETLTWITEHGTMELTADAEPDPTHVYFVRDANGDYTVGSYKYAIVIEPNPDDMATYYELSIDESLQNYVGTHLALDGEGLWVLPSSTGHRVLIATGTGSVYTTPGTYIIDPNGNIVARMGEYTTIGNALSSYTSIRPDYLGMYDSNGLRYVLFGNGIYSGAVKYAVYKGSVTADAYGNASIASPGSNPTFPMGTVYTVRDSNDDDVTSTCYWSENIILYPAGTGYQDNDGENITPDIGEGASFLYE